MPHLTLEYTDNLIAFDARSALRRASEAMFDSGLFTENDIKCRARGCSDFCVGVRLLRRGFVHAHIALMPGRSIEERKELAAAVLVALRQDFPGLPEGEVQFSVETVEIDRATYAKAILHG